ncbi:uncharacterized protein LOC103935952 [Pyrus x bretschneideri]|uniref:uncharacterized protein LOC103935952 n=1 Tax=Pyrus x bretschneideri TaxID=225117 RepID=UPI0020300751|nr:uncharacterized protein LOC103935952 [Pyrus x bretschneideri]XP_048442158.1 uncharacterized protein LOC103935952 [Pyrus x bretschneideri]XP_048442159.1 uncharacterized protein LOC103935952 [Pyrus x bretschneideri]XP_048442160.1 uncharacterized protein LOC103935952 [Pyrus x bretschneideri]XP_048442161.1 uncharacterized protein LOC103935952 [Pyrus x bretschneideri]
MAQLLLQRRKKSQMKAQMRVAMIRKMMMKPLQRLLRKKAAQLQRKAHQWLLRRQTLAALDLKRALNLKMRWFSIGFHSKTQKLRVKTLKLKGMRHLHASQSADVRALTTCSSLILKQSNPLLSPSPSPYAFALSHNLYVVRNYLSSHDLRIVLLQKARPICLGLEDFYIHRVYLRLQHRAGTIATHFLGLKNFKVEQKYKLLL